MTTPTLPGTIPGLLRLCSPVYSPRDDLSGVVVSTPLRLAVHSPTEGDGCFHDIEDDWELDLSDPTGRAHAAWWALATFGALFADTFRLPAADVRVLRAAGSGEPMTDAEIERLRLVCLHVAGVRS